MKDFTIKKGVLVRYNGKDGDVVIPDGVTGIGEFAFYSCKDLVSVVIPNSVTEISKYAFEGCNDLTSINIPDSVTKIGDVAFRGCSTLTSITIPDSVTEIGWGVFRGCIGLTSINIPDAVVGNISYIIYGTKIKRIPQGHIAYKGFNADMTCRDFQYEEGKTYVCDEAQLCERGFHACLNPLDCFIYYYGDDAVYHEVILEDRTGEIESDSKVCGKKITIGRRLSLQEMVQIFNELNK